MRTTTINIISNSYIKIPVLEEYIFIYDIRSIVLEGLYIKDIIMNDGRVYQDLNKLPKD